MFGRLSFSCTLLYLIDTDARIKSWPVYASIFMQAAINIIGVIAFYSQCGSEVDAFWTLEKQLRFDEICWNPRIQTDYGYFMGSWNTVTDVYLAVLPAILIHHTTMSLKRKVGVAALLCLSFLAMASSIVKTYEVIVFAAFFFSNLTVSILTLHSACLSRPKFSASSPTIPTASVHMSLHFPWNSTLSLSQHPFHFFVHWYRRNGRPDDSICPLSTIFRFISALGKDTFLSLQALQARTIVGPTRSR